jgi:polysaccharide export outer membrane protein
MKAASARITPTALALLCAALPCAFPAASAAESDLRPAPAAGTVVVTEANGLCELSLPAGAGWRLEMTGPSKLSLVLTGASLPALPESAGACSGLAALGAGGSRIELATGAERLKSIEQTAGRLRLVIQPPLAGEAGWEETYRIGVDDKLLIAVLKPVTIQSEVVVDKDGTITVQGAGAVRVAGLTTAEAAAKLRDQLDRNYLVDPEVSVIVKEYASQFVFVGGQVRTPGKRPLRGGTTLKEVLAEAGGFTDNAGDEVVVTRELRTGREPERVVMARHEVERERADMSLRPGDTITVSERKYFFITGQVMRANKYPWEDGMTLLQAISMAGGLAEWANRKDVRLLRVSTDMDKIETLNYDLRDIEKGKLADVPIMPGDRIIVNRRLL